MGKENSLKKRQEKENHNEKRHGIKEERDPARRKENALKKRQEKGKLQ
jgi:hypothetical protein